MSKSKRYNNNNYIGICTINTEGEYTILATLEKSVGKVFVNHYDVKAYCIEAHVSPISYL